MKNIVTIDGPAGAGKGTIARLVARGLGYKALDTGKIYRVIAYKYLKENKEGFADDDDIEDFLKTIKLDIVYSEDGSQRMILDGEDVTIHLHTQIINEVVANKISFHLPIRTYVKKLQNKIAEKYDIVAEGRDVGTNVFPDAQYKFFVQTDINVRAERRLAELKQNGDNVTLFEQVLENIRSRDERDAQREHGKMQMPKDAVLIDNTYKTGEESAQQIIDIILHQESDL